MGACPPHFGFGERGGGSSSHKWECSQPHFISRVFFPGAVHSIITKEPPLWAEWKLKQSSQMGENCPIVTLSTRSKHFWIGFDQFDWSILQIWDAQKQKSESLWKSYICIRMCVLLYKDQVKHFVNWFRLIDCASSRGLPRNYVFAKMQQSPTILGLINLGCNRTSVSLVFFGVVNI